MQGPQRSITAKSKALGVEQQQVHRLLIDMEAMTDWLSDAEGCQIMGRVAALELWGSLHAGPATIIQLQEMVLQDLSCLGSLP
jgi:hypothetical protein